MALLNIVPPTAFAKDLASLENNRGHILGEVLTAGGRAAADIITRNIKAKIGGGTKYPSASTGELVRSFGVSPVNMSSGGSLNVKAGFREPRSDGEINARIANIIEHGRPGQSKSAKARAAKRSKGGKTRGRAEQQAKPMINGAERSINDAAIKAMQEELNKQLQNL